MSFSYDLTLAADRDYVRFLIQDTASATALYANEELDGLLNREGNVYLAASKAILARIAGFVEKAIRYRVGADIRGALEVDRTKVTAEMRQLAKDLREQGEGIPTEFSDAVAFGIDRFGRDVSEYQGEADAE